MKVSILITTFDRPRYLRHSLDSLCRQSFGSLDFEVVVVNDGVDDEVADIVARYASAGVPIKHLFTGQRNTDGLITRHPGYALNIAIQQSDADIIVLSNSDVYHIGETLLPIVWAVMSDPLALGTLGQVHDDDGRLLPLLERVVPPTTQELEREMASVRGRIYHKADGMKSDPRMPYFLAVRRERLLEVGGYDEDLNGYACDDSDLMARLCEHGCHYVFTQAEAVHLHHGSRAKAIEARRAAYNFNARLQRDRAGQVVRNEGRRWGQIKPEDSSIAASICIATFDKAKLLKGTLESIYQQKPPFEFETIVVDDGSPPGSRTRQICKQFSVRYHRIDRPHDFRNPCTPRNIAYRLAKGRVIIAQSDEVVHVNPDTIERLVADLNPGHVLFANVLSLYENGAIEGEYVGIKRRPHPLFFLGSLYRADLYAVGGNDEEFQCGPAYEDRWFSDCLMNGLHLIPKFSQSIVGHHVWHPRRSNPEIEKPSKQLLKDKRAAAISGKAPWCSSGGPWSFDGTPIVHPSRRGVNSIVVCVEYDDFLAITLEKNRRHFDRTLVVTTWGDTKTHDVAACYDCECFNTTAFTHDGTASGVDTMEHHQDKAAFNKGSAMEAGFDLLGREGWICVWDADILMPETVSVEGLDKSCLYTPIRHLLEDPTKHLDYVDESSWQSLPSPTRDYEFSGYFQLFHASTVPPPWYGITSTHAGVCDSEFEVKFPEDKRKRPPFVVLHLGPEGTPNKGARVGNNWAGRVSPRIDTGEVHPMAVARQVMVRQIAARGGK